MEIKKIIFIMLIIISSNVIAKQHAGSMCFYKTDNNTNLLINKRSEYNVIKYFIKNLEELTTEVDTNNDFAIAVNVFVNDQQFNLFLPLNIFLKHANENSDFIKLNMSNNDIWILYFKDSISNYKAQVTKFIKKNNVKSDSFCSIQ